MLITLCLITLWNTNLSKSRVLDFNCCPTWPKDNFTCPQVWLYYLDLVQCLARNILQTGHSPNEQLNSIRPLSRRRDTSKTSTNGKYSDFVSKRKRVLFNYCSKLKKYPFKKMCLFMPMQIFAFFIPLFWKKSPFLQWKYILSWGKKSLLFSFYQTRKHQRQICNIFCFSENLRKCDLAVFPVVQIFFTHLTLTCFFCMWIN